MAIIQFARRNSGSETAIKVFAVLTENIELHNGRVLLSQVNDGLSCATKMSLFVKIGSLPDWRTVGERNIWLKDDDEGLMIFFAHEKEARVYAEKLYQTGNWEESFPVENYKLYNLKHLDRAARDMRNFILIGALPSYSLTDVQKEIIDHVLKEGDIDVVATFDPGLVDFDDA